MKSGAEGRRLPLRFLRYAIVGDLTSRPPNIHDSRMMSLDAVIVVDKPGGWTSHDVVAKLRGILHERAIGHLGTLDPMATGVLPLVTGKLTRLARFYVDSEKEYEGTIRLGFATDTYDAQGQRLGAACTDIKVKLEKLRAICSSFVGSLPQYPPPFSAKKVGGVPAYKLARRKQDVNLQPVEVEVKEFEATSLDDDLVGFRCRVSSGTYVRSLAHELGLRLGIGAHVASLRRTRSAEFTIEQSHRLEDIAEAVAHGRLGELLIQPRLLLPGIPCITADAEAVGKIRHGRTVNLSELSQSKWVKVFSDESRLICLASRVAGTLFQPKVVVM